MRRKLLNKHKIKRKWNRRLKKTSRFLSHDTSAGVRSDKDFAWKSRKQNPYARTDGKEERKIRVQMAIILLSLGGILGVALYHPFFHIKHIRVQGLERIGEQEFTDAVRGIIAYQTFFIFPKKNFFLIDTAEIEEILSSRFPLASIQAELQFPENLHITVEEKVSTLIYDNGKSYSYVGLDGRVIEILRHIGDDEWVIETKTVTSTDEQGNIYIEEEVINETHFPATDRVVRDFGAYPIVYDQREKQTEINATVLKDTTAKNIFAWFQELSKKTDISFQYMIMENELSDAIIKTGEGWDLKIKLTDSAERQLNDLQLVLREKINRNHLQYIDVRYPGRVYWQ